MKLPKHTHDRNTRRPSSQKSRRDREIADLRRALEQERRHAATLEREVASLREQLRMSMSTDRDKPLNRLRNRPAAEDRLHTAAARRADHYRERSFVRYLFESVMESYPVGLITKLLHYLRRLRVVQLILTLGMAIGAVVVVTILSAAALPFLLFGSGVLAILAVIRSRHANRRLRGVLEGRHIRVLVPPRGQSLPKPSRRKHHTGDMSAVTVAQPFFVRQAYAMAAEEGVSVIVVSPYLLSGRGLGGRGAYFTARREGENLYIVRRHYYFFLRRRVLDVVDPDMTVIY